MEFTTLLPGEWSSDTVGRLIGQRFDMHLAARTVRGEVVAVGFAPSGAPTITVSVPVDAEDVIPDGSVGLAVSIDRDEPAVLGASPLPADTRLEVLT